MVGGYNSMQVTHLAAAMNAVVRTQSISRFNRHL
jgi:hypothetical protein